MLFSLCSVTALAEGFASYEEYEADLNKYFESLQEEHEFVLRVCIRPNLSRYVNYVTPDLALNFKEVDTGKVTEIKLNKDNYISDLKCFELPIDFAESGKDTKFTVSMTTADEFLTGFYDDSGEGGYCKANNGEIPVTITEDGLTLAICNTRTDNFILYTVDENGVPLGNMQLRVFDNYTKEFIEKTGIDKKDIFELNTFEGTNDMNVIIANKLGVITGVSDTSFEPSKEISRQGAAALLMRAAQLISGDIQEGEPSFADNSEIADCAKKAVSYVTTMKIMNGVGEDKFEPTATYTREQAYVTIVRLFNSLVTE